MKESPPPQTRQAGDYGKKKRGRVAKTKGRNLWERFKDYEDGILAFMTDPAIPFTNNQAERDIRMTKVHEKVSGGFRSPQGALFYCRIRSYLSTCSKRGIPGHEALRLLFSGALPDFVNLAEILGELMEIVLPLITAIIIDQGLEKAQLPVVYRYGALMVVLAALSLVFGAMAGSEQAGWVAPLFYFLGIAAVVLGLLGLAILILDNAVNGVIVLGVAFLISPYGLPMLAAWLIPQLHGLRYAIQDAVYN